MQRPTGKSTSLQDFHTRTFTIANYFRDRDRDADPSFKSKPRTAEEHLKGITGGGLQRIDNTVDKELYTKLIQLFAAAYRGDAEQLLQVATEILKSIQLSDKYSAQTKSIPPWRLLAALRDEQEGNKSVLEILYDRANAKNQAALKTLYDYFCGEYSTYLADRKREFCAKHKCAASEPIVLEKFNQHYSDEHLIEMSVFYDQVVELQIKLVDLASQSIAFIAAVKANNIMIVRDLYARFTPAALTFINSNIEIGRTSLHCAVLAGSVACAQYVLD